MARVQVPFWRNEKGNRCCWRTKPGLVKTAIFIRQIFFCSVSLIDRMGEYESSDTGAIPVPSTTNNNHFGEGGISPCELLRKTSRDRHLLIRITG